MKLQIPFSYFIVGNSFAASVFAFQPSVKPCSRIVTPSRSSTRLNDVSEWRDLMFEAPSVLSNLDKEEYQEGPLREICILPFPLEDTLIQGETKELCLYEERFHKLFTKSTNEHGGVVAMGLLAPPAGILQTMPLCEIESFRTMQGDTGFGTSYSILATIRSVGRASLIYIDGDDDESDEDKEFLTGWCTELGDNTSSERLSTDDTKDIPKVANRMADRCEEVFNSILEMEEKITESGKDIESEFVESEATLRRKLLEAELDIAFDDEDDDEDEDDEDDFDDEDESDSNDNERNALQRAFELAKTTDTQGYRISTSSQEQMRSIQDLTALSWAYFSTELDAQESLSYRLRALEIVDLSDRLKLALVMMMERRSKLRATLRSMAENEDTKRGWEDDEDDNVSL